ncbi:uncharacterized protein LOC123536615 [Mercenaria mercenaria]|uniref:uncharacterized protein LOC123536615 n=1 Tax=Mercenaria mercenaria TaxID=6596 RepID=UPI00234FB481|nr:uncharacterized protein LOC123536615 [Mercenaria mercenaria]
MATAFAITGIHRSRLKYYRPSYQSELPPIYEDAVQRHQFNYSNTVPGNDDYMYVPNFMPNGRLYEQNERRGNFVHDYEEIDTVNPSQFTASRPGAHSKTANTSMLDGIMSNRFQLKNKNLDSNLQNSCDSANVGNADELTKTGEKPASSLRRSSTVYQGHSLTNGETSVIKTNAETTEETSANKGSSFQWPKLKPDNFIDPHFWCPAEKKIQRRCFVVCFIVLLLVIAIFVIVSLDGWIYSARGRGLAGREKPILFAAPPPGFPPDNFTDIRPDNT